MINVLECRPVQILLVEDTPTDARLTLEAFKRAKVANQLSVVENGLEALKFLRQQGKYANVIRPDLLLLDLKLPVMDGHELLAAIKADEELKSIAVVVLTASLADADVVRSYNLYASCYITKPSNFTDFVKVVSQIESFWSSVAVLPSHLPPSGPTEE
jgi:CheY-like chemotaxis protein